MSIEQKKNIREQILNLRKNMSDSEKISKEQLIIENIFKLNLISKYHTFMVYSSFGDEINTWQFIDYLYQHSVKVAFPKIDKNEKKLKIYYADSINDLNKGIWDILEPDVARCQQANLQDIDCILVPGLAFDDFGYRVGYGGGYYDKLLADPNCHAYKISIAFEFQHVKVLPKEHYDIPIDTLVTEEKIYYLAN